MAYRSVDVPCAEERHCYFHDYHKDKRYCRCLTVKGIKAPYKSGKCAFYKKTENSYSGSYDGEEYSEEMRKKIEDEEFAYMVRRGILSEAQANRRYENE